MRNTFNAFTVPAILAPLLPPFLQPLRMVACGALYAGQRQR